MVNLVLVSVCVITGRGAAGDGALNGGWSGAEPQAQRPEEQGEPLTPCPQCGSQED